ncbi:hypothetical protein BDV98DRAFT_569569 [Pterulicium gracile]|uniref:Uncharacterized protein n=1 Tax=Pterulicium gracile TaxID=1884261 RepID=A0A5C3QGD3_9AGAR|nr:hypothetical protein BDV98DRAFT_569569 [Pterula gracilis]
MFLPESSRYLLVLLSTSSTLSVWTWTALSSRPSRLLCSLPSSACLPSSFSPPSSALCLSSSLMTHVGLVDTSHRTLVFVRNLS